MTIPIQRSHDKDMFLVRDRSGSRSIGQVDFGEPILTTVSWDPLENVHSYVKGNPGGAY
jgi:hypothetical protein